MEPNVLNKGFDNPAAKALMLRVASWTDVAIVFGVILTVVELGSMLVHLDYFTRHLAKYPKSSYRELRNSIYLLLIIVLNIIYLTKVNAYSRKLKNAAAETGNDYDLEAVFLMQINCIKISILTVGIGVIYSVYIVTTYIL